MESLLDHEGPTILARAAHGNRPFLSYTKITVIRIYVCTVPTVLCVPDKTTVYPWCGAQLEEIGPLDLREPYEALEQM